MPMRHTNILLAAMLCVSCTPVAVSSTDSLQSTLAAFENDAHDDLHSVIVIQGGRTRAEHYYHGADPQTLVDIRSAGKSVTSLLLGVALDQGAIKSLDAPVQRYWTDAAGSAVGSVRLENLLTMRSGLAADDDVDGLPGNEDRMDDADDPLSFARSIPSVEPEGSRYRYNSLAAYVTGVVIAQATGRNLEEFARKFLFEPLGMKRWEWQEDRSGQTKGQGNLFLTARDFARIGQLVLGDGVYEGKRIVSRRWIEQSLRPRVDISASDPFATGYGYYWYHRTYPVRGRPTDVYFASGNGGNKIYVIPDLDMVVSILSRAYGEGRGQRRSEAILKAVLANVRPL
ncbi:MAG TPA: serine hydrolase [Tahibacter sp.]|nr:serine hydrolase [Tahibacter sp.]